MGPYSKSVGGKEIDLIISFPYSRLKQPIPLTAQISNGREGKGWDGVHPAQDQTIEG